MKKLILIAVVCAFVAAPGLADPTGTVQRLNGSYWTEIGNISGAGYSNVNAYTSVYTWTVTGYTGEGASVPSWGFCIELPQEPVNGWYDVRPLGEAPLPAQYGTPMGDTKANLIKELWARNFQESWIATHNAAMAEAFAACVWEIVYEELPESLGGTTGDAYSVTTAQNGTTGGDYFYIANADTITAQSWLDALTGAGPREDDLRAITNANGQDFLVKVPVPAAVLLGLLGLGTAGARLRRRSA